MCWKSIYNFFFEEAVSPPVQQSQSGEPTVTVDPIKPSPILNDPIVEIEVPNVKKALIVGVGKQGSGDNELFGPPNDAADMYELLVDTYKFSPDNVKILLDELSTKDAIISGLNWLVEGSIPGDELLFYYTGHGSQITDYNGDESDNLDEILIPYDHDWYDPLTDDILHNIFSKMAEGVYLSVICDSCHSGTITDQVELSQKTMIPPEELQLKEGMKRVKNQMGRNTSGDHRHVLITGCQDVQYSMDAVVGNNVWRGVMSFFLIYEARLSPDLSWAELHQKILVNLLDYEFEQLPELSGNKDLIGRKIFGGTE